MLSIITRALYPGERFSIRWLSGNWSRALVSEDALLHRAVMWEQATPMAAYIELSMAEIRGFWHWGICGGTSCS